MKKSSKLFSAILAVMLMVSALGAIPANAVEAEVTVNSLPELEEAIAAAVNGDMIYIAKDIDIQEEVSLGSVDKTVFLAGAEGTSVVLSISPDFPDGLSLLRILYFVAVRAAAFHLSRAGAPLISRQ